MLVCSSVAGALGGVCGNPGDVVNVRMQNDGQLPVAQRRNYRNALDGVIRITREEGVTSLMRGVGPNINRAVLMTGSQLVSYDVFKDLLLNTLGLKDGVTVHFGSSLLAVSVFPKITGPAFCPPSNQPTCIVFTYLTAYPVSGFGGYYCVFACRHHQDPYYEC